MKKILVFLSIFLYSCGYGPMNYEPTRGKDGKDGYNSLISVVENYEECQNGGTLILTGLDTNRNFILDLNEVQYSSKICNGKDGNDGQDGKDGEKGQDGQNGDDGKDGNPTTLTPIELINPCGDAPGILDEILIKVYDGTIIASLSDSANGKNTRFVVLSPGTYETTDGDKCGFRINSNGTISNETHNY